MSELKLFAGPRAMQTISENGLRASDFSWMAGASGGPKWFVLYGLDRYLAGSFFVDNARPLRLVGSSAGAWRLACYAHSNPVQALDTLAARYAGQTYSSARPDRHEISREARKMLQGILGDNESASVEKCIAENPQRRLYVIADRARRVVRSENKLALNAGLLAAAVGNMVSRRSLSWFFERYVFHNALDHPAALPLQDQSARFVMLNEKNVCDALMASGSIPLVMEAVTGISGAGNAVFRDGGITDYHLDLPFNKLDGLVLYPHFYASVIPGWFDKFAPWHRADPAHFDNVLLVTPTKEFVQSLPYGKIPDRNDFVRLGERERIIYWQTVLKESERLAVAFAALVNRGADVTSMLEPFTAGRLKHV
tara:strand:- start:11760 stop:12860 length:1101 start_codon:yes stop_codon:yes gene_type:complete